MNHDNYILSQAEEVVYDRPDTHGEAEDSFGKIAGLWNAYLGFPDELLDAEDVANLMILLKVSRNKTGHYHKDNYVDIAGYSENAARLREEEEVAIQEDDYKGTRQNIWDTWQAGHINAEKRDELLTNA